ncbi:uncharacterized protein [Oscarella lobularis]|uniref:uncharacterized protein n=1 Tax=Oscarella lobularis TaxID=121494 RepID=UPI003313198A
MVHDMSVRDRINNFEALNKTEESSNEKTKKPQRFLYPGAKSKQETPLEAQFTRNTTEKIKDFESGLTGAWNIRKNVAVSKPNVASKGSSFFSGGVASQPTALDRTVAGKGFYSRHGGAAGSSNVGNGNRTAAAAERDEFSFSSPVKGSSSFQSTVPSSRSWRSQGVYSYTDAAKRPRVSPTNEETTLPAISAAKRKAPLHFTGALKSEVESKFGRGQKFEDAFADPEKDRKLKYAQKMMMGHMKSAGLGEFAPNPTSTYKRPRRDREMHWDRPNSSSSEG